MHGNASRHHGQYVLHRLLLPQLQASAARRPLQAQMTMGRGTQTERALRQHMVVAPAGAALQQLRTRMTTATVRYVLNC
jgi:hypothetical protein